MGDDAHRPGRKVLRLRPHDSRDCRQRRSTRCQMQKLSPGKSHGVPSHCEPPDGMPFKMASVYPADSSRIMLHCLVARAEEPTSPIGTKRTDRDVCRLSAFASTERTYRGIISHDGAEEGPAAAQIASVAATVCLSRGALRLRRGACRYASLADLYCAFGITFLRGDYHQILGPRRHLPKFSNSLCRYAGVHVRLNLHLGWQAAESYVERSNAFALIPGHGILADCSAAEQPAIVKALLSRDMRRSEGGMGRSKGSRTISWV